MGVPSFPPPDLDDVRPYWDALQDGRLALPGCARCGKVWWYPLGDTPCHPGAGYVWSDRAREGTVYTFSTVHRNFLPGDTEGAPFMVGLVEPDGLDGVRVVALLQGLDEDGGVIGRRVTLSPVPSAGYTVPAFRPVPEED